MDFWYNGTIIAYVPTVPIMHFKYKLIYLSNLIFKPKNSGHLFVLCKT